MDESGHDHKQTPYEVRGGFAIRDGELWPFILDMLDAEYRHFGARLVDYGSEIKGQKLLVKDKFKFANQMPPFSDSERQTLSRALLQAGLEKRGPTRPQLTAYGQACIGMADSIFDILTNRKCVVFAAAIPRGSQAPPSGMLHDGLRKDHIFLLERFFYFLEHSREHGLLVMDEADDVADRRLARRIEGYFTKTANGRDRARRIVPSPLFVSSAMALPVQAADVVTYCINWGYRHPKEMDAPCREEIAVRYGRRLDDLKWRGDGYNRSSRRVYKSFGIFCVPDLYVDRK